MPPLHQPVRQNRPRTVIIAYCFFIFVSCSLINSFYRIISTRVNDNAWDLYIFTQNWPPSVCLTWEEKGKDHFCTAAANKTTWTIHGIWPTKYGTIGPQFCNNSYHFNPEAIAGLRDELNDKWSPVEKNRNSNWFWKHEWEKHGTCASTVPNYPNEFEFFNQGLKLSEKYNITTVLSAAGIVPGYTYNVSAIWLAVKQAFGKNPHINCATDVMTQSSHVVEIKVCLNKTFDTIDCDGIKLQSRWNHRRRHSPSGNFTNCTPNQLVEYPITIPYPPPAQAIKEDIFVVNLLKSINFLRWATS